MISLIVLLGFLVNEPVDGQPSILNETRKVEISYEVHDLPGLNTERAEFSPSLYGDQLVFASDREYDFVNVGEHMWKKHAHVNLFRVDITTFANDSLTFSDAEIFEERFMTSSHSGPVTFSKDGNLAILNQVTYFREKDDPKVKNHKPILVFSQNVDGKWTKPQRLPFVNLESAFGHPSLAADGKTLYFSSDMPGGEGGKDIYKTTFDGTTWSKPENLGPKVNSKEDEVFPFWHEEALYFSSNGRKGKGGLDIYVSKWTEEGFADPENIGEPMNSKEDDFGIIFKTKLEGYFSSNREEGSGGDDIYRFQINETVTVESNFVAGRFKYRELDGMPSDLKVMLVDEDGNIVMNTETNENGEFIFRNLDDKQSYIIRIEGKDDMELILFNENGEQVAYLLSNEKGEFLYKRLKQDYVGTLSLIGEDQIDDGKGDLTGQFIYEHLPSQYASQLKVMLVDENGNIVYTTTTDDFGNFEFTNLPMDANYLVRMEKLDDDLTLLILNKDDNVTAILRMDGKGDFVFRKLDQQYNNSLQMMATDDRDLFSDLQGSIFGQFNHRNLEGNFGDGLKFEVLDENGNIVMEAITDKKGFFRLAGLPLTESYVIKIPSKDPDLDDIQLTILNRNGKKVAILDKDKDGYFVYTPLGLQGGVDLTKIDLVNLNFDEIFGDLPVLYYSADSWALNTKSKGVLNELVKKLKDNPDTKVEVNSYADSRASEEYNLKLSQKRTNSVIKYLKSRGIPEGRLGGNAYGESKILNDCGEGVKCPEELHQVNRRSEIRVY